MAIKKISEFTSGILSDGDKIIVENADGTPKSVEYVHREFPLKNMEYTYLDEEEQGIIESDLEFTLLLMGNNGELPQFALPCADRQHTGSGNFIFHFAKYYTSSGTSDIQVSYAHDEGIFINDTTQTAGKVLGKLIVNGFRIVVQGSMTKCENPSIIQSNNSVSISCTESGASIKYRIGSGAYQDYAGGFNIISNCIVYAYAEKAGMLPSDTASKECTYTAPQCAVPVISQSGNTVSITCSTPEANIYYRIGSSGSYNLYNAPFSISSTIAVYAYAQKDGYIMSEATSKICTYSKPTLPTPQITVEATLLIMVGTTIAGQITNYSSFPSGTVFDIEVENITDSVDLTDTYNGNVTDGEISGLMVPGVGVGDIIRMTITATCSGYNSSSGTGEATTGMYG